jgi:thioester reductase-like protein
VSDTVYLLTGFPRFLPRRLALGLLARSPQAQLKLLVQDKHREEAEAFRAELPEESRARLQLLLGDVAAMHLGLSTDELRELSATSPTGATWAPTRASWSG